MDEGKRIRNKRWSHFESKTLKLDFKKLRVAQQQFHHQTELLEKKYARLKQVVPSSQKHRKPTLPME